MPLLNEASIKTAASSVDISDLNIGSQADVDGIFAEEDTLSGNGVFPTDNNK
jgi:hypothetical protein